MFHSASDKQTAEMSVNVTCLSSMLCYVTCVFQRAKSKCCQSVLFPYFSNVATLCLCLLAVGVKSIYVPFIIYREFDGLFVSCRYG